jgi:hypothetical protein
VDSLRTNAHTAGRPEDTFNPIPRHICHMQCAYETVAQKRRPLLHHPNTVRNRDHPQLEQLSVRAP